VEALGKLKDLCCDNEINCATVSALGGVSTIVGIMRKWKSDPEVCGLGCDALQEVEPLEQELNSLYQKAATEAFAPDMVVWAMKKHPNNAHVQAAGIGFLCALAYRCKENALYIAINLNGINLIIKVMKKYGNDVDVQEWGCCILHYLAEWEELKKPMIEAGSLSTLARAVEIHVDDSNDDTSYIQEWGRSALHQLTGGPQVSESKEESE